MKTLGLMNLVTGLALGATGCAPTLASDDEPADHAAIVVAGRGGACASETTSGLFCLTGLVCREGRCVDDPDRCAPGEHVDWRAHDEPVGGVVLRGAPPRVLCVSDARPSLWCDACDEDEKAVSPCLPRLPQAGHGPVRCIPKRTDDAGAADELP